MMTNSRHYFTSITSNYLPKARVLASSVKRIAPSCGFHLVLSDDLPAGIDLSNEPFDSVIKVDDLAIQGRSAWIFKHTVVELCTAVKGLAALEILRHFDAEQLYYFDPDMVVFGGLDELADRLARSSILLTPHLTDPEVTRTGVVDNEISALRHGVFNLGFLGVNAASSEGRRFLEWWADRLIEFCYDDIAGGLFTDQRWVDLAPGFFDGVEILREPNYNVATWNLSNRVATGSLEQGILVNGRPLAFYHFSGFDAGAQEVMLGRYGRSSPVLFALREWYFEQCRQHGQEELGRLPCKYSHFDNGQPITRPHRLLYRDREDLQTAFPNPFDTSDVSRSYCNWFSVNATDASELNTLSVEALRARLWEALRELDRIKRSRSWRLASRLAHLVHGFR